MAAEVAAPGLTVFPQPPQIELARLSSKLSSRSLLSEMLAHMQHPSQQVQTLSLHSESEDDECRSQDGACTLAMEQYEQTRSCASTCIEIPPPR
jgi:hypothetical protein